jgi:hypothetical protein
VCSVFVTAQTTAAEDLLNEVADALVAIGVPAERGDGALVVDGNRFVVAFVDRAHPTPAALAGIVDEAPPLRPAMVIADRISEPGREVLRRAGWGWLDRRGHLRLWTHGVRIEAPIPGLADDPEIKAGNPWTTVGLEVAVAALLEPTRVVSTRHVAPLIGRSVGAVHEMTGRLAAIGLIGNTSRLPLLPDLFWETAAHWPDDGWMGLPVELDEAANRAGPDVLVRVDERAATLGGARIAAAGDQPARAYVPNVRVYRRLRALADRDAPPRIWVRVAPVRFLPENTEHPADAEHPWTVAHPLICALRLAADPARGREIVEDWGIVPDGSAP